MEDSKLEEIINNMERMNEDIASLNLEKDKAGLVLYGSRDIHLPGLLNRTEKIEEAIKAINGMPQQVKELKAEVKSIKDDVTLLVQTDQKRVWMVRGAIAFATVQGGGLIAIIAKVFS